jgi:hypothetical protein
MTPKIDLDRRQSPRVPYEVSLRYASYQNDDYAQTAIGGASSVDLSNIGMQLALSEPVKVPAYVQVAMRLTKSSAPIILLGKTIWCRPDPQGGHRAGIQFLGHVDSTYSAFVEKQRG